MLHEKHSFCQGIELDIVYEQFRIWDPFPKVLESQNLQDIVHYLFNNNKLYYPGISHYPLPASCDNPPLQ